MNPPDFSHCWTYFFDTDMSDSDYMDFISDLRETMLSADTETLESEKDFMEVLARRQQARADESEKIQSELLTSESLLAESTAESGTKELHIMWMTEDGIFCRKQGQTSGYEWMIPFDSEDQYKRIKELFESFDDENMPEDISTREFWEKYLTEDQAVEVNSDRSDSQTDMLLSETVQARFPMQEVDEEGNPMEDLYLVAIDGKGIRCSKPGEDTYVWEIEFTDEAQYEKATTFMDWANDHMDNFLFSAHQNFWEDYLNGDMDVEAFQEFLAGTNNGLPDYSITVGDSMYVDKSKIQWAQYMNPLGAKFYTAEEMLQIHK
jgi:hypothetical protein